MFKKSLFKKFHLKNLYLLKKITLAKAPTPIVPDLSISIAISKLKDRVEQLKEPSFKLIKIKIMQIPNFEIKILLYR